MEVFLTVFINSAKTQGWLWEIWIHIMFVTYISEASFLDLERELYSYSFTTWILSQCLMDQRGLFLLIPLEQQG